jgi:hypothetical protein
MEKPELKGRKEKRQKFALTFAGGKHLGESCTCCARLQDKKLLSGCRCSGVEAEAAAASQ